MEIILARTYFSIPDISETEFSEGNNHRINPSSALIHTLLIALKTSNIAACCVCYDIFSSDDSFENNHTKQISPLSDNCGLLL